MLVHEHRQNSHRFVANSGNLEPALALAVQNAFTAVAFAAEIHELEKLELIDAGFDPGTCQWKVHRLCILEWAQ